MGTEDVWKPLFVGSVVGGPTGANLVIRTAVKRLAQTVQATDWDDVDVETGVDAVFHITGPLMSPDYVGIRLGRFSKADRLIAVQIAVPVSLQESPEEQVVSALAEYLVAATDLAAEAINRRRGTLPVHQAQRIARRVTEFRHGSTS